MTRQINKAINHGPRMKHTVCLLVLLFSVNALAETPVAPENEAIVAESAVDPYEAIKWKGSTGKNPVNQSSMHKTSRFRISANTTHPDTKKVFKDDYERVLITVGKAKSTEMIWLRD